MSSENMGAGTDLDLHEQDAENVVGGLKKKKKATTKKVVAKNKPASTTQVTLPAVVFVTPTRAEMDQANQEAIDQGIEPPYPTTDE